MKKLLLILIIAPTLLLACGQSVDEKVMEEKHTESGDPILEDNLDGALKTLDQLEEIGIE